MSRPADDPWAVIEAVFPKATPNPPERPPVVFGSNALDTRGYASSALEQEAAQVAAAPPGTRNHTLNRAAFNLGQLVAGGALDEHDVVATLTSAATQAGLDGVEIVRTIRSGLTGGAGHPRGVPEPPDVDGWLRHLPSGTGEPIVNFDPVTGEVLEPAEPERGSWWPRDLGPILTGDVTDEPAPAFLARGDGHRLFYAGKVNALIGESESGKTWIGLLAVVQALQVGEPVLYLDFEDTAPGIVTRLRLLGCTDAQLGRLHYIGPDESLEAVNAKRDLRDHLAAHPPALIVFDGVNAAMTLLGLDLEKNKDATQFSLSLLRPLKRTGAAVVTIDHVTKSKDNRGSYAIGAQAKRADIDGCALLVEVVQPFGKGMRGKLRLTVSKDRPGQVRAVSAGAKNAGMAYIDSTAGDRTDCWIEAPDLRPDGERPPWRPTVLMERVSEFLQQLPGDSDGVSQTAVEKAVTGNVEHIRKALAFLVEDGFAERIITAQGAKLHLSVTPYTAPDEGTPSTPSNPVQPRPRTGSQTPSTRPPPSRGTGDGGGLHAQTPDPVHDQDTTESWWQR